MKGKDSKNPQEPVGIVISGTQTPPRSTVFAAYEYSPAPANQEKGSKAV